MIYKVYTFQYEVNKFLYGLGKGHQQYKIKGIGGVQGKKSIFLLYWYML